MNEIPKTAELFDLAKTSAKALIESAEYPWEVLGGISDFVLKYGKTLSPDAYDHPAEDVWIAKDASIAPSASITGPCIIESGAEIRHCAYIRGGVLVGAGSVVGNSCELKNCVLFEAVQVPHFNYAGDSILGYKSHLGAGAVLSNVKSDKSNVTVRGQDERVDTGRKKFGAILGDHAEIGCNSVLFPGSIIGRNSVIYPLSAVRGVVPQGSIFKDAKNIIPKHEST